jgi:hypothetical protein
VGALCCVRLKPSAFDGSAVNGFYEIAASCGVRVANGAWVGDEPRDFRLGFGFQPMTSSPRRSAGSARRSRSATQARSTGELGA